MAGYATSGGGNNGYYFGIRRCPYSTDITKNGAHLQAHRRRRARCPTSAPIAAAQTGANNAEVHNTGEVWATMLWECYARAAQRATRSQEAQDRMKRYLVAAYKADPATRPPSSRRATRCSRRPRPTTRRTTSAFVGGLRQARRGRAARWRRTATPTTHAGVVESFVVGKDVQIVASCYEDDPAHPATSDGMLDNGETGSSAFVVLNNGTEPADSTSVTS